MKTNIIRKITLLCSVASFIVTPVFGRVESSLQKGMFFQIAKNTGTPVSFNLTGSELIFTSTLSSGKRDIMKFDAQIFIWGSMQGWSKDMHYGNIYAIFPFGPGRVNLKVGQQIVPFGMQTEYDTHGQLFQPLYALNIGERIDIAISVFGIFGPLDYWYMISNGNRPNMADRDDDKVHTLRLATRFQHAIIDLKTGVSLMRGVLPDFTVDPFVDMEAVPDTFIMKNRAAFDIDAQLPLLVLRGEFSAGTNGGGNPFHDADDRMVYNGYAEARLPLSYTIELMGMYSFFRPAAGADIREFGMGLSFTPADISAINLQLAGLRRTAPTTTSDRIILLMVVKL